MYRPAPPSLSNTGFQPSSGTSIGGGSSLYRPAAPLSRNLNFQPQSSMNNSTNYSRRMKSSEEEKVIRQKRQEQQLLKGSRSGIRRFSVHSAAFLHNKPPPTSYGTEYGQFGQSQQQYNGGGSGSGNFEDDDVGEFEGIYVETKSLQESLQEMHNKVKWSSKMIINSRHSMDLEEEEEDVYRIKPFNANNELKEQVNNVLRHGSLVPKQDKVWHKYKKKWKEEDFYFEWPEVPLNMSDGGGSVATAKVNLVIGTYDQYQIDSHCRIPEASTADNSHGEKQTSKRDKKVKKKYELHFWNNRNEMALVILNTEDSTQNVN